MSLCFPRRLLFPALAAAALVAAPAAARAQRPAFRLTVLHTNDGESDLLPGGAGYGGAAAAATLVEDLRDRAVRIDTRGPGLSRRIVRDIKLRLFSRLRGLFGGVRRGEVVISSGDNFLAGPQFNASLERGVPFYDSLALGLIGYDASAVGNHEFDFGPDVLADFIAGFRGLPRTDVKFVSANLDLSAEPALRPLIAKSAVLNVNGVRVGVVGATTPLLPFISSPRDVLVTEVAPAVQAEVDALLAGGTNVIILTSHLQAVDEDVELLSMLTGVDVAIAGGGDDLLANPGDALVPGDEGLVSGAYPLTARDLAGGDVPVVTTSGQYRYVGRLIADFDAEGNLLEVRPQSGPVRVAGPGSGAPDAVAADPLVQALVSDPVAASVADLAANVLATSDVALNGERGAVRGRETNLGNLIADALLATARDRAAGFGVPAADVALQNGGGIRAAIDAGPVTELETFATLPFSNFVSVTPDVPRATFKELLENAVSRVEFGDGRFAQVAGFSFTYDPAAQARTLDAAGGVVTAGERVLSAALDDGTVLIQDGAVVDGASLTVATVNFLARGGDQYPFGGLPFTSVGVTYQQSLEDFLTGGLGGVVSAADYPEGGAGRITAVDPGD